MIVVGTEGGTYKAEDNGVAVSVTTQKGSFSEPVILVAEAIAEGSKAYETAEEELSKIGHTYDGMVAFDIHFESKATGKEVEPDAPVDVELKITDAEKAGVPAEAVGAITVAHIFDNGGAEIVSEPTAAVVDLDDEITSEFQAEVFSTYTISWGNRQYRIHYVDTDGRSLTPTRTPEFSNDYKFLIYDIEGYEYDSTHYGSRTGTAIKPLLANYGNDRIYLDNNNNWQYLRNDIYVVYKAKETPTTGGTPKMDSLTPADWPQGDDAPQFYKSSTNNGDGTNTVALSIEGGEKEKTSATKADVIVVFDVSGSMSENLNGQTRLERAKTAVKRMANTLLNEMDGVRMALVSFSTTASTVQGFTDNYTTYSSKVNGLTADGGTNWEQALSIANHMAVDSNAATFIVFVTDGDPTFRISRDDVSDSNLDIYSDGTYQYYRNYGVFGTGYSDDQSRNFNFAVDEVESILSSNKNFYAIGVSSDVTKVQNLVTQSGGSADHAFLATNNTALDNAFSSITQSIRTTCGFGDVEITDGITELANVEMKVMQEVDPDSFTYYKVTSAGQTEWDPASEGAGLASYDAQTGAVTWNMGEDFQLEEGVRYMVTFRVWPSQEAYDLVASLNNGEKVYASGAANSITAEERAQVVEVTAPTASTPGSYALKTNTDSVNATYSQVSTTGESVTVSGSTGLTATYHEGTLENMSLASQLITIKKTFEDDLTGGEDRDEQVKLILKRKINDDQHEFADFNAPGTSSPEITLNDANNWSYSFYVAPGFIVDGETLEKGYQFTVTEPEIDYHYELLEEVLNPMVVDGTLTLNGDADADKSLTAVNRVKSGIDVKKVLLDKHGNEILNDETEFTITGKILKADGTSYTFNNSWDNRSDKSTGNGASADWQNHQNDPIAYHKYDKDGNRVIYKGHFDDTASISFTLKAGEYIRFINVPEGCTFEFTEAAADGYNLTNLNAVTQHRTAPGGAFTQEGDVQPTKTGSTASLTTGVVGNKQYSVEYTNQRTESQYFYVYHSSDNTIEKISVDDDRVTSSYNAAAKAYTYEFNIVNETKADHLYGGYYSAYKGAVMTNTDIINAVYNSPDEKNYTYSTKNESQRTRNWKKDTSGCKPYDGSLAGLWTKKTALTEHAGISMQPEVNGVYYLKEVPDQYFRPALYYVYDKNSENQNLKKLHLMVPTDDNLYQLVCGRPITLSENKRLYGTFKAVNDTGETESFKVADVNTNLTRGFLTVWDGAGFIEETKKNQTYEWIPNFVTLDGVEVTSCVKRIISTGNLCHGTDAGNFSSEDIPVDSAAVEFETE